MEPSLPGVLFRGFERPYNVLPNNGTPAFAKGCGLLRGELR